MKIELNITGLEPFTSAINNLAAVMGGQVTKTITEKCGQLEHTETVTAPVSNQPAEAPTSTGKEPTPAEIKKSELVEQIVALGGEPPLKGSVAKFEECLAELQKENPEETPEETSTPTLEETSTPTLEEARMLAAYVIKNQDDFDGTSSTLGKTKLGAAIKKVEAKSITDLFEQAEENGDNSKVVEFVSLLEKSAKKTLSEVVAETSA